MLGKELWVHERQLHGISDRLDLVAQPANVFVSDVGDFLEDKFFDLGLGHPLKGITCSNVAQQSVSRAHFLAAKAV